jgi:hypothetical protein
VKSALDIAREHLALASRDAERMECADCGALDPPTRHVTSADGNPVLCHVGCPSGDDLWLSVVHPRGWRSCLGPEDARAVCEALLAAHAPTTQRVAPPLDSVLEEEAT